ncbi:hypothetical protein RUR49_11550, partial [Pseudoxanthobacter sp. M-2]|uniref:hypothetical protein n=1 Tax=Pseudoxanthobacter sp. M-2 TaxID=3078754 RepID=UPI0038FC06DD
MAFSTLSHRWSGRTIPAAVLSTDLPHHAQPATAAIERAVEAAERPPDVPIAGGLVEVAAVKFADAVMGAPAVKFATNGEPWFQSYVTLGSLLALVGGCYGLGYDFLD